jgi:hypothetical protein
MHNILHSANPAHAPDLLEGAGQIAAFLFEDPARTRSVYHLAKKEQLPVFRLGATLCARRSRLRAWIEDQENAAHSSKAKSDSNG